MTILTTNHLAFGVSLGAMCMATVQAIAAWVQNRQNVRPFLTTAFDVDSKTRSLSVMLGNSGLGPAIINDFWIQYKDIKYRDFAIDNAFKSEFKLYSYGTFRPASAIAAGQKIEIFSIPLEQDEVSGETLQKKLGANYRLGIDYESFMGQHFEYRSGDHEWPISFKNEIDFHKNC